MAKHKNKIVEAREASGMTEIQAAACAGFKAIQTYKSRESDPSLFSFYELRGIYNSMNENGKRFIKEYVVCFFDL
jgi:hypothetical protein